MTSESRFFREFKVLPHPQAPTYSRGTPDEARLILRQVVSEASSRQALSREALGLIRETALVNLYFCSKYVLGPFNGTSYANEGLQLDMCNFRQSPACMDPGSRAGVAIFRGSGKTDLLTVDAGAWELLRDPQLSILVVNAKKERAEVFTGAIQACFMYNPLVEALFPAWCAWGASQKKAASAFVLSNRPFYRKEPSVKASGCTGSTEGDRADLLDADDLIGLDDLTAENLAGSTMTQKTTWFKASEKANLRSLRSRYLMKFTTFGAESLYSEVFSNIKLVQGDDGLRAEYPPGGSRKWSLYMRDVIEAGEPTLPEVQTKESLADLEKSDPMLYYSQYRMLPRAGGLVEFKDLVLGEAALEWEDEVSPAFRLRISAAEKARVGDALEARTGLRPVWDDGEDEVLESEDLSIHAALDPAGTGERDRKPATSRSVIHVWARDWHSRAFLVYEDAGFWEILEVFTRIRVMARYFRGVVESLGVEKAAMQKIIRPVLERERDLFWDDVFMGFHDDEAGGDKDARIRFTLGPLAARGLLWVVRDRGSVFKQEFNVFPLGRKKDAVDAAEKCLRGGGVPPSPGERAGSERRLEEAGVGRDQITGY